MSGIASLALRVPKAQAETVRIRLAADRLLRRDLEVQRSGEAVWFPISDRPGWELTGTAIEERSFEELGAAGPASYKDLLNLPEAEKAELPRAFDVVGDVVLIRIPPRWITHAPAIGSALLRFVPGARVVGLDLGVHGNERTRTLERIAGEGPWRTQHRENGIALAVDPSAAYFSPRLATEHARVAASVRVDERVLDLCCGVGPFALSIARDGRAQDVTAVDANPAAIELLNDTRKRYGLADRLASIQGALEQFLTTGAHWDRVIFNLPHEGIKYAPLVARAVAARGTLHYYEVVERSRVNRRFEEIVKLLDHPLEWSLVEHHVVHPYAPTIDLVAWTLRRSG